MSQFALSNRVKIVNPSANVDKDYGPYESVAAAFAAISATAAQGKTVGVIQGGSVVEYWFKDAPAGASYVESELVQKTSGAGSGTMWINQNTPPQSVGGFSNTAPATGPLGLTFQQFANQLLFPALAPIINSFNTTQAGNIPHLQSNISFTVNWAYTIRTADASIKKIRLRWKRTTTGGFTTVVDTDPGVNQTSYAFSLTGNTLNEGVQFELTITDSADATVTQTITVNMAAYAAPTISGAAETGLRERGLYEELISRTVVVNTPNRPVTGYNVFMRVDRVGGNGTYAQVGTTVPVVGGSSNFNISHNIVNAQLGTLTDIIGIRIRFDLIDAQQTTQIEVFARPYVFPIFASTVTSGVATKQPLISDADTVAPNTNTGAGSPPIGGTANITGGGYVLVTGTQIVKLPPNRALVTLRQWNPLASTFDIVNSPVPDTFEQSTEVININGQNQTYTVYTKTGQASRSFKFIK